MQIVVSVFAKVYASAGLSFYRAARWTSEARTSPNARAWR